MSKKIACIGDSITYGTGIIRKNSYSYPSILESLLDDCIIENYGAPGFAVQKQAKKSYWEHPNLKKAIQSKPNIIIFMLGSNDCKVINWQSKDRFINDYKLMINELKKKTEAEIIIGIPPIFITYKNYDKTFYHLSKINMDIIRDEIRNFVKENNYCFFDLEPVLDISDFIVDFVHPNKKGARKIAEYILPVLKSKIDEIK